VHVELEEYKIMFEAEDHHWWYQGLSACTRAVLDRWVGRGKGLRILDAGCGTGLAMTYLDEYGTVTGVDLYMGALKFCRQRGLQRLVRASVLELPFPDETFDLITSFDVLSECGSPADEQGMREFWRVLRPGGWLLLRLPAYQWLSGTRHDEAVMTRHRYTRKELVCKMAGAGYVVEHASYANTFLFPIALTKRVFDKLVPREQAHSDAALPMGPINVVLRGVLKAEAPWVKSMGLPFGLTVVVLARKT